MRNAEATREKILDAAMAEFSAHGVAGARVDRIAATAGCNKNLIYIYFENKETLFATLLRRHLTRVYEELRFTPDDLPGYAVRLFDFSVANPDLMRLMAWFSLEKTVDSPPERQQAIDAKLSAIRQCQDDGAVSSAFPPAFLMTLVMNIATGWSATSPFGPSIDPAAATDLPALRNSIAQAVTLLTAPPTNRSAGTPSRKKG